MKKEYTRADYFAIKHKYLFFHFLLQIVRILFIFAFITIMVFLFIFANKDHNSQTYIIAGNISRYTMIFLISFWIILKIIDILFKRKLKPIKRKLDIVDEI